MKLRVKIALCVLLMIFAAASLLAVLANLGVLPTQSAAGENPIFPLAFSPFRL